MASRSCSLKGLSSFETTGGMASMIFCTESKPKTVLPAERSNRAPPITIIQRVSSQALYQSISVLHRHGLEKDVFQRHRADLDGLGVQRARFGDDSIRTGARQHRQHSPLPAHARDAGARERDRRRIAVEHELHAAVARAHVVERALDDD